MTALRVLLARVVGLIGGRRRDGQLADEIEAHLDLLAADHIRSGLPPDQALAAARRDFGGIAQVKETYRDQRGLPWVQDAWRDAQYAVRALAKTPAFTVVAILTLALGIGANTAIFSLINSLILRDLPVKDPARVVVLSEGTEDLHWSYPVWDQIRQRPELFEGLAAWSTQQFNLAPGGKTEFVNGLFVNGAFFDTLGVQTALGRTFTVADDTRGGGPDGPVTVIGYAFWQRRFGGAADAVGRVLTLDGTPFTIVGIAPPEFFGLEVGRTFDLVVPFGDEPLVAGSDTRLDQRNREWITIAARLAPSQTMDAATAALRGVQRQVRELTSPLNWTPQQVEQSYMTRPFTVVPAPKGVSGLRQRYERPLMTIMVVVGVVLLIACANLVNLLLARATARAHELSTRAALGASRGRLVRQLLTESCVLVVGGTAVGLVVALWASRMLVGQLTLEGSPTFLDLSIDTNALAFTTAMAVATTLLFGSLPALRASRAVPMDVLKGDGRSISGQRSAELAGVVVVAQVTLSLVLVVAAGLFIRTFVSLATRDIGFAPDRVLVVDVNAQRANIAPDQRVPLFERARQAVLALPDVSNAGISLLSPVRGEGLTNLIQTVSGGGFVSKEESKSAMNFVSPGWFATLGLPLVAGLDLTDRDRAGAPLVMVVNQAFARRFLSGASPLGHSVTLAITGPHPVTAQIVGLTGDAVYESVREPLTPTMFLPLAQQTDFPFLSSVRLSIRSKGRAPELLTNGVVTAIEAVNPRLALTFHPLSEQIDAALTQERVVAVLAGLFGGLALLLASVGLYGVMSYTVSRRRTEIGIRLALGATSRHVAQLVLTRVLLLVFAGIVLGVLVSMWASRFVATLLYGLEPRDPATLVGGAVILTIVAVAAGWLPTRRAARVDPAITLRYE